MAELVHELNTMHNYDSNPISVQIVFNAAAGNNLKYTKWEYFTRYLM